MKASKLLVHSLGKVTYESENLEHRVLPKLLLNEFEIVPVTHDEIMFYANDGMNKYWNPEGECKLYKKLQELSVHASDFIYKSIRHLNLSEYKRHINNLLLDNSCLKLKYFETCVTIYLDLN
ncbi:3881_t:CDS:2 [Cetraspora pellucida]|uniref:3881_t:CDS:1 n=1 Tax=Cetraspora pellucida TaxID=1433469 RepID=A0A9N9ELU1_9GLOM|nr:3881_t:CDS:2 [Cetraspora pellucida]